MVLPALTRFARFETVEELEASADFRATRIKYISESEDVTTVAKALLITLLATAILSIPIAHSGITALALVGSIVVHDVYILASKAHLLFSKPKWIILFRNSILDYAHRGTIMLRFFPR